MADEKYLTKEGLQYYTGKMKEKINNIQVGTFFGEYGTKALLDSATGMVKNDYAVVTADETKESKTTRYRYNGTAWLFEYVVENNDCIKLLPKEPGSNMDYRFPFNINAIVQDASQITTSFDTLVLNDGITKNTYPIAIPSASIAENKAGLYNKTLADEKVNVVDIVNDVTTGGTTKPLSAEMGKELNDRCDALSSVGRYLAMWDCTTGLPTTNPPGGLPYTYKTGDYYLVSAVKDTLDNLIPNGTTYNGSASTITTTAKVSVNDTFRFDGTTWTLLHTDIPTTTFGTIVGEPDDNAKLKAKFDGYIAKLPKETYSGLEYQFPFNINPLVQTTDSITTSFDTLVLNDGKTRGHIDMAIPSADIANDKAGLYTKALADAKTDRSTVVGTSGTSLMSNLVGDEGACMKFEHTDGTWSGIAVNNGGKGGLCAQIYAVSSTNPTTECMKINVMKQGIYYMKNKATGSETDDDEIATMGDVKGSAKVRRVELKGTGEKPTQLEYDVSKTVTGYCLVQVYDTSGNLVVPNITQTATNIHLQFNDAFTGWAIIME